MKLAAIFTNNMVLQRDCQIPVWGRGAVGETVTIEFAGQKKSAQVPADGNWQVQLDPLAASCEPQTLIARSTDGSSVALRNVLVGDVWLCSGQSNMEWTVESSGNPREEIAAANYPLLRQITVPNRLDLQPLTDMDAVWQVCSPATAGSFTAVGYYFGRELNRTLNVPIGLINSSWGGTRIEAWISRAALLTDADGRREIELRDRWLESAEGKELTAHPEKYSFDGQKWARQQGSPDPGNQAHAQGWATVEYDDSSWKTMKIPSPWQAAGEPNSGVFWFRRVIDVPPAWAGKDLELEIGACDKTDITYFNNIQVGSISYEAKNCWSTLRIYRVPGHLVKAGRNVIAVRIYSNIFQGGMTGPESSLRLSLSDDAKATPIPLAGPWRYRIEHDLGLVKPLPPQSPLQPNTVNILYDSKIMPVVPFALRGFTWYQGESNGGTPREYRSLLPLMIRDWRRTFGQADLPFLIVQLANFMPLSETPVERGSWAELREAQLMALSEPNTGLAVAIDIGEAEDIHPKNKQDVGKRLALIALAKVHGQPIDYSGPLYKSHQVEGPAIRLHFHHVGDGLKTSDGGPLKAFAIAGADEKFVWANAQIDGETIIVQSAEVPKPVAVRYAWANNPSANLFNSAGLPASPFRTDVN